MNVRIPDETSPASIWYSLFCRMADRVAEGNMKMMTAMMAQHENEEAAIENGEKLSVGVEEMNKAGFLIPTEGYVYHIGVYRVGLDLYLCMQPERRNAIRKG